MEENGSVQFVIGPDGERMTRSDLPPPGIRRWVPRRKARVVAAVEGGLISHREACERYALTDEELESWKVSLSRYGLKGLCVTKLNTRRGASE